MPIKLSELNDFICCPLCQGYLIDATTVNECLHTFCKTCIVKHIENDNNECPKCNTIIHERRPLDYIIQDRNKQDIVYKLVPQLYITQLKSRLNSGDCRDIDEISQFVLKNDEIYVVLLKKKTLLPPINSNNYNIVTSQQNLEQFFPSQQHSITATTTATSTNTTTSATTNATSTDQQATASLAKKNKRKSKGSINNNDGDNSIYLRCPSDVRVKQLRKLLIIKYQLGVNDKVTLLYKGDIVNDDDQVSNLAQSVMICLHYEISRLCSSEISSNHFINNDSMQQLNLNSTNNSNTVQNDDTVN